MAAGIIEVTGMVLTGSSVKEYDKRIEILTKERGRIAAFATGARRAGSTLSACTVPFTYGTYWLCEGRNSYYVRSADISIYFHQIAEDFDILCYASYFSELTRYYTRENVEAPQELLLLYVTCSALVKGQVSLPLMRSIFEMRMMQLEGEALELFHCLQCGEEKKELKVFFKRGGLLCRECAQRLSGYRWEQGSTLSPDALYALQFILTAPLQKLYTFRLSEEVERELSHFMKKYFAQYLHHDFKSLQFL